MKTELIKLLDVLKDETTFIVAKTHGHRVVKGDVIFFSGEWVTVSTIYFERTRFHIGYYYPGIEEMIYGETNDAFFLKRIDL